MSPRGKLRTALSTTNPAATNKARETMAATRRDLIDRSPRSGFSQCLPRSVRPNHRTGRHGAGGPSLDRAVGHLFDVGERQLDRVVEVVTIERREQAVPEHEVLQPVAQLDEGEVDSLRVQ